MSFHYSRLFVLPFVGTSFAHLAIKRTNGLVSGGKNFELKPFYRGPHYCRTEREREPKKRGEKDSEVSAFAFI
jgi:hypothetical protein